MEEKIKELKYIIRSVDEPSTTTTYIGYALQSTPESSTLWIVKKILLTGYVTSITYAMGSWTNRASLTYN